MLEGGVELVFRGCDDEGKIAGEPQRRPVSEGSFLLSRDSGGRLEGVQEGRSRETVLLK